MKIIEEAKKKREEGLKTNPRYDIDHLADEKGEIKVYFHSKYEYDLFRDRKEVKGSTERFFPGDLFIMVPKERIEKITDGGTIAHIPAL